VGLGIREEYRGNGIREPRVGRCRLLMRYGCIRPRRWSGGRRRSGESASHGWHCSAVRQRREERYSEYADLVKRSEREFHDEPYFLTFQAIVARLGRPETSALRTAVEYSRRAASLLPDVAGVLHQVAAFLVEYLELVDDPLPAEMSEAESYAEKAITLSSGKIGHFFETKARVLALRGEFSGARAAIGEAIELEPRGTRDHARRVAQYQTTRVRIDMLAERRR